MWDYDAVRTLTAHTCSNSSLVMLGLHVNRSAASTSQQYDLARVLWRLQQRVPGGGGGGERGSGHRGVNEALLSVSLAGLPAGDLAPLVAQADKLAQLAAPLRSLLVKCPDLGGHDTVRACSSPFSCICFGVYC